MIDALDAAVADRQLDPDRVRQSVRRRLKWAQWAAPPNDWRRPSASDAAWGAQLCDRAIVARGDDARSVAARAMRDRALDVVTVRDDAALAEGGAPVEAFVETLRTAGLASHRVASVQEAAGQRVVALCVAPPASPELAPGSIERLGERVAADCGHAARAGYAVLVVLFAHERLRTLVPSGVPMLCAWTGDAAMQRAAARWISSSR